jgi:hypothetical protein
VQLLLEPVEVLADAVEVGTPAHRVLGEVHGLLDFLLAGSVQLRHLGVEEQAVLAAGLRMDRQHQELLVLVGDRGLAEFPALEQLPLVVERFLGDPIEEAGDDSQGLGDLLLDIGS